MKRKDISALHAKTKEELLALKKDLENELLKLKTEAAQKKLKNVCLLKTKADDLARVNTVLSVKN